MDLSIIIPCHNLEDYINKCIDSLLEQTNKYKIEREIIFICDRCTDKTKEIIESRMKRIRKYSYQIFECDFGNPGEPRNIGLNHATGKYIWFIDGDDWLTHPNAIDVVYHCMEKDDMDIVEFKIKSPANPDGEFGDGTVWRVMFSNRIIGDTRFNQRQLGEDNDFYDTIISKKNVKYGRIADAPYYYNSPRDGSQMTKYYGK